MATNPKNSRGGGIFIMLGAGIGLAIGSVNGQPSAGLLLGIAAGAAVALALYLKERRG